MQIKSQIEYQVQEAVRDPIEHHAWLQAREVWQPALEQTSGPVMEQVYIPLLNRIQHQLEQDIGELLND
jgi:hypothetical protein